MIGVLSLGSYGFVGGTMGNLLAQWEASGVFSYVLPFLLLFALVFGILTRINLFKDSNGESSRAINAIIALSVALMSLQFDFVSMFFAELFPRFGIALSIILVVLIGLGLFLPKTNKGFNWGLIGVMIAIIGIVIFQSLTAFSWGSGGYWILNLLQSIWPILIIVLLVIIVVAATKPKNETTNKPDNLLMDILGSGKK